MSLKPFSVTSPNLPIPPDTYTRQYHDQFNNILRLFFNQITNFISAASAETVFTVAALPSAAKAGAGTRYFVTDSTSSVFYNIVVGGGTIGVGVTSDGTAWRIG